MELRHESEAQTLIAGLGSVQSPATMQRKRFRSALLAPMFWKTGRPPGLSRLRATPWLVDPEQALLGSGR